MPARYCRLCITECWELGAGYWELGAGCWVLVAWYWVLGAGSWVLGAGFCALGGRYRLLTQFVRLSEAEAWVPGYRSPGVDETANHPDFAKATSGQAAPPAYFRHTSGMLPACGWLLAGLLVAYYWHTAVMIQACARHKSCIALASECFPFRGPRGGVGF